MIKPYPKHSRREIKEPSMAMILRRPLQLGLALLVSSLTMYPQLRQAKAQEAGWITLFDGKDLGQWDQVGTSNWHLANGTVIADRMDGKEAGYLVSKKAYKNFVLRVEFWPSADANTGIYFRCQNAKKITDRTCYEANVFDERPDPSYGTGSITYHTEIYPMPKAGGKWNTLEITANGRDITVLLNGSKTAELRNGMFDDGPIALQHGSGTIKIRKVEIKPL
jgi:hypothetical protein